MTFLKRLLRGSSIDPLAPTSSAIAPGPTGRPSTSSVEEVMASFGASRVESEVDDILDSRTWQRVDGTTTERFDIGDDGDVTLSIDGVDATRVAGPGGLEAIWSRAVDRPSFYANADSPSAIDRMIEAECSADIAKLAVALGSEGDDDMTFLSFSLSPTGHTNTALFLSASEDDEARNIERIPRAMPALRDLAHSMRAASTGRLRELFPWYTGSPSLQVPANPIAYLERASQVLDPIAKAPASPNDDASGASWTWSDPVATDAKAETYVEAATGSISIAFGCESHELVDGGVYPSWSWQPATSTWAQSDLFDDDPVALAYLARFGGQVTPILDQLASHRAYEFTIGTDSAGNVIVLTSIDVGEESIEHVATVLELLRSNLDALRH